MQFSLEFRLKIIPFVIIDIFWHHDTICNTTDNVFSNNLVLVVVTFILPLFAYMCIYKGPSVVSCSEFLLFSIFNEKTKINTTKSIV